MPSSSSSSGDSSSENLLTDEQLAAAALGPKAVTTEEGRVEERSIMELIALNDHVAKRKPNQRSPIRFQVHKGPGTP